MIDAPMTAREQVLKESHAELLAVAKRLLERGYVSECISEEHDDHMALVAAIAKAERLP